MKILIACLIALMVGCGVYVEAPIGASHDAGSVSDGFQEPDSLTPTSDTGACVRKSGQWKLSYSLVSDTCFTPIIVAVCLQSGQATTTVLSGECGKEGGTSTETIKVQKWVSGVPVQVETYTITKTQTGEWGPGIYKGTLKYLMEWVDLATVDHKKRSCYSEYSVIGAWTKP